MSASSNSSSSVSPSNNSITAIIIFRSASNSIPRRFSILSNCGTLRAGGFGGSGGGFGGGGFGCGEDVDSRIFTKSGAFGGSPKEKKGVLLSAKSLLSPLYKNSPKIPLSRSIGISDTSRSSFTALSTLSRRDGLKCGRKAKSRRLRSSVSFERKAESTRAISIPDKSGADSSFSPFCSPRSDCAIASSRDIPSGSDSSSDILSAKLLFSIFS
ncbi:MAG: hypothetical protein E7550_06430 [Ruminococcaceae bacterium]|nr:hypothetical protein [Oscillospiraceae bacterium]